MMVRFKVDFIPPPGAEGEPFQTEFDDARSGIRFPDIGERLAFIDQWGRRQAGRVLALDDLGFAADAPPETKLVAITVQAYGR